MLNLLAVVAQTALLALLAPAVVGYVRLAKARLQGRRGAGMLQPYRELRKTFGKGMVIADTASWIFHLAPFAIVGATIAAASLVPVVSVTQPADQLGDLFVLTALLMLGTFFLALGGLDPAYGIRRHGIEPRDDGRGAHRADPRGGNPGARADDRLDEPRRDCGIGLEDARVCDRSRTRARIRRVSHCHDCGNGAAPGRQPGHASRADDDPRSDDSRALGSVLAWIEWAAAFRLTLLLTLAANLFVPWGMAATLAPAAIVIGLVAIVIKLGVLGLLLAVLETRVAKLRLFRVPELLALSFTLALLAATSSFFTK